MSTSSRSSLVVVVPSLAPLRSRPPPLRPRVSGLGSHHVFPPAEEASARGTDNTRSDARNYSRTRAGTASRLSATSHETRPDRAAGPARVCDARTPGARRSTRPCRRRARSDTRRRRGIPRECCTRGRCGTAARARPSTTRLGLGLGTRGARPAALRRGRRWRGGRSGRRPPPSARTAAREARAETTPTPTPLRRGSRPRSQGRSIRANVGVEFKGVSWS
jgi:hypothetical protein